MGVYVMNYLALIDGFDIMCKRLISETASLYETAFYGCMIVDDVSYMNVWGKKVFPKLCHALMHRNGKITERDLQIIKTNMGQINCQYIIPSCRFDLLDACQEKTKTFAYYMAQWKYAPEGEEIRRTCENTFLTQSKSLITAPYLNVRIRGINLLLDYVANAKKRLSHLSTDNLVDFVKRNNILGVLLNNPECVVKYNMISEPPHYQLVKRCENIIS